MIWEGALVVDINNFVSLVEKVKSEKSPYFISSSASGSPTSLQASDWLNISGTYFSEIARVPSIDYSTKEYFEIEPKRIQPEPIKAWVMSRHIAYFDPETSTYHMVSMTRSIERQWLTTLVFNIMSTFM